MPSPSYKSGGLLLLAFLLLILGIMLAWCCYGQPCPPRPMLVVPDPETNWVYLAATAMDDYTLESDYSNEAKVPYIGLPITIVVAWDKSPGTNRIVNYKVYYGDATRTYTTVDPAHIEMEMIRHGGRWKKKDGAWCGEGLLFHYRSLITLLWPEIKWHAWAELQLQCYLDYRIIGQIGPASTGKSFVPAACALADYYCFPSATTVLVSSTTRESLEMRVWGELKKLHKLAKERHSWLPGYLIEGRQRIITDPRSEAAEGRDFRNGLVGVACKRGQSFQGIEEYVGIKNKRLRMLADELQFLPKVFVDSISNMNKNPDFKCVGSGNPKDTTDALGVLCEPAAHLGGWDGGIDQVPKTKTWETRFTRGICIQLCGADSPNLNGLLGIPLITQEQIDADIKFYGRDSIQFTMMDMGMMPRGQGSRRVITRQLCLKFGAMDEPVWLDSQQTRIGFVDAAYKGTGGDRCVFGELRFGLNSERKQIVTLIDTMVVPISDNIADVPEDQIAQKVRSECERRMIPPQNVYFDSTGRGTLMSSFARNWSPQVNPVEFGGPATERPVANGIDVICRDYYFNFVTELWFSVRLSIESGQFRGMTEDVMAEGCQREWLIVGANKIQVEPKDKMKLKTGRSPDLFDGLACGLEGCRRRGFVIERVGDLRRGGRLDAWKRELKERSSSFWKSGALSGR